jgi:hypothetical protein
VELPEKLAALTPRPRINLLVYHGVLDAHGHGADGERLDTVDHRVEVRRTMPRGP